MKSTAIFHKSYLVLLSGRFFVFLALILNIWVVGFLFAPDNILEWPNTFYVLIFQLLLGIIGCVLLIAYAKYDALKKYFYESELKKLAFHAFLVLFSIDILLQLIFFFTVNHPGDGDLGLLYRLFHLDREKNIPSTYSALQFILAGIVTLYCMKIEGNNQGSLAKGKFVWLCVSFLLFCLGIDEYFSFHENAEILLVNLNLIPENYDNELGGFGYSWTLVGVVFVVGIGVPFSFLFFKIFSKYYYLLYLLLLSGGIFVLGAIGMENFQVYIRAHDLNINGQYILMLEEFFEMLGVSMAIFVFIRYCGEIKLKNSSIRGNG